MDALERQLTGLMAKNDTDNITHAVKHLNMGQVGLKYLAMVDFRYLLGVPKNLSSV